MYKIILQKDCFKTCNKWAKWQGLSIYINICPQGVVCPRPGAIYMYKSIKIYTRTRCQVSVYRTTGLLVFYNIHRNSIKFSFLEDNHVYVNNCWQKSYWYEWPCDKKLSEVDVRSNKWHETYQNVHFSSFQQLVGLAVGRWLICCAHGARVVRQNIFFRSEAEKKTFSHRFWWVRRETGNETNILGHRIALPCCGYS